MSVSSVTHKDKQYIIPVLHTRFILLSSFIIFVFCICHLGGFPIVSLALSVKVIVCNVMLCNAVSTFIALNLS